MYFESSVNIPNSSGMIVNASLDLLSKNMSVSGVKDISLSDSQSVHVSPLDGNLLLGYNRDFDFSGRIVTGGTKFEPRFVIHGKNLSFSYDDFIIDLPEIDSIRISVPLLPIQRDRYGNEKLVKLKTVIQSGINVPKCIHSIDTIFTIVKLGSNLGYVFGVSKVFEGSCGTFLKLTFSTR